MFTVDKLMEIAMETEETYKKLLKEYPAGTINDERNAARDRMEDALLCASWMEKNNIKELANVGPFFSTVIARGNFVKIKKGAIVYSTDPEYNREGRVNTQNYTVKVHDVYTGHIENGAEVVNGKIHWAGRHGYWKWCSINDVEIV